MIVEIREEARGDLYAGYRFYEEQAAGLGRYFLECIFADIDSLGQFAGIHESVDGFQRKLSKRSSLRSSETSLGFGPSSTVAAIQAGFTCGSNRREARRAKPPPHPCFCRPPAE